MSDLVDSVLVRCGIIPETEPPVVIASHGQVADRHRLELIRLLELAQANCSIMASLLTWRPDDDWTFDLVDKALGNTIAAAAVELRRFRQRRECQGAG